MAWQDYFNGYRFNLNPSDIIHMPSNSIKAQASLYDALLSGELSATEYMKYLSANNWSINRKQETTLNNLLNQQNTADARAYETEMANSDLLRAASQLSQLGLSANNVLSTGGSATPNVAAANTALFNEAADQQRMAYMRKTMIASSLINMAGRMASSGISGGLNIVRGVAGKIASQVAHSASKVARGSSDFNYDPNGPEADELLANFREHYDVDPLVFR